MACLLASPFAFWRHALVPIFTEFRSRLGGFSRLGWLHEGPSNYHGLETGTPRKLTWPTSSSAFLIDYRIIFVVVVAAAVVMFPIKFRISVEPLATLPSRFSRSWPSVVGRRILPDFSSHCTVTESSFHRLFRHRFDFPNRRLISHDGNRVVPSFALMSADCCCCCCRRLFWLSFFLPPRGIMSRSNVESRGTGNGASSGDSPGHGRHHLHF